LGDADQGRAFAISQSVIGAGGFFLAGSSPCRLDDLRQEAINADFAAPFDVIAACIRSA
jgi:hypothetical protein